MYILANFLKPFSFLAGAGSVTLNGQTQTQQVASQLAHPQYNPQTIDWDYMVITLSGTFTTDAFTAPIALCSPLTAEVNSCLARTILHLILI